MNISDDAKKVVEVTANNLDEHKEAIANDFQQRLNILNTEIAKIKQSFDQATQENKEAIQQVLNDLEEKEKQLKEVSEKFKDSVEDKAILLAQDFNNAWDELTKMISRNY